MNEYRVFARNALGSPCCVKDVDAPNEAAAAEKAIAVLREGYSCDPAEAYTIDRVERV